mgnify:CR=1 FL=1
MIETVILGCVMSCVMSAALIIQEIRHDRERKDLLNRIMARDYAEYQAMSGGRPPPKSTNFIKKKVNEDVRGA